MAHFARLNAANRVVGVYVVPDEAEHRGEEFMNELGVGGRFVQCSYTGRLRRTFPGIGDVYDEEADAFVPGVARLIVRVPDGAAPFVAEAVVASVEFFSRAQFPVVRGPSQ